MSRTTKELKYVMNKPQGIMDDWVNNWKNQTTKT